MKVLRTIHELYSPNRTGCYSIGKYHYIYLKKDYYPFSNRKISLIRIKINGKWLWEAWGFRMHHERRFKTRKLAEEYIKERLK